jgi:arylsulfatase A-like enzyme
LIKKNDVELGRLLVALESNGDNAETIVYVLSDHGFGCPDSKNHKCSPNTFITSNNVNLAGDLFMEDVAG